MIACPSDRSYLPYQVDGIRWLLEHPNALLADQMGLGKTVQVCGLINADPDIQYVLILCPASLKSNWARELSNWCMFLPPAHIVSGKAWDYSADVAIVNYDILHKHTGALRSRRWDLLVMDEAHYLKSFDAQRTKQVIGTRIMPPLAAKRKVALTGTPIVNRPVELYPILRYLDGQNWPDFDAFGMRYCGGVGRVLVQNFGGGRNYKLWKEFFGADSKPCADLADFDRFVAACRPAGMRTRRIGQYTGADNLEELNARLKSSIMLRRLKDEVLKDLPAKVRDVVELDAESRAIRSLLREERAIWQRIGIDPAQEYASTILSMAGDNSEAFEQLSTIRRETAVLKAPLVVEHLLDAIDSSGKVVCFMHHKESIAIVREAFPGCAVVVGETPSGGRQEQVDRFQQDPSCQLFLGSRAAAEGITLTAAAHVVLAEWFWEPGIISQMEDRCHRIGQKDSVLVQHLVLAGSLDAAMAKTVVRKQRLIAEAID
jgi:SWI/SNF-related matrix-associated actin-dependent regulator of chromatin subfamily A-like protein 1